MKKLTAVLFLVFCTSIMSTVAICKEIKKIVVDDTEVGRKPVELPVMMTIFKDGSFDIESVYKFLGTEPGGFVEVKKDADGKFRIHRIAGKKDIKATAIWSYKGFTTTSFIQVHGQVSDLSAELKENTTFDRDTKLSPIIHVFYTDGEREQFVFGTNPFCETSIKPKGVIEIGQESGLHWKWLMRAQNAPDTEEAKIVFSFTDGITVHDSVNVKVLGQIKDFKVKTDDVLVGDDKLHPTIFMEYTDKSSYTGKMNNDHHPEIIDMQPPGALVLHKPLFKDWYLTIAPSCPSGPVTIQWQVQDGILLKDTSVIQVENRPRIVDVDLDTLPQSLCSHVGEKFKIIMEFNESMDTGSIPMIELNAVENNWIKADVVKGTPKWSVSSNQIPDAQLELFIELPEFEYQSTLQPKFRISKVKSKETQMAIRPYIESEHKRTLFLMSKEKSWIIMNKTDLSPRERVVGRINTPVKEGEIFFVLSKAPDPPNEMISFKYARPCEPITWNAPKEKGSYQYRIVQKKRVNDKWVYSVLVRKDFYVK